MTPEGEGERPKLARRGIITLDKGSRAWCHKAMGKEESFFFLFMLLMVVTIAGIYIYLQKPRSVQARQGYQQMMYR